MKKKILSLVLAIILIIPVVLIGCKEKDGSNQRSLYNVYTEPDTFWVEYSSYSTSNSRNLYAYAKVKEEDRTLYYAYYTNAGANHEYFVSVNNDDTFTAFVWDYQNQTWVNNTEYINSNYNGTGNPTWFDFQTSYLSGYMSMALGNLSYGLSKSNADIQYVGLENYELIGTTNIAPETIEAEHYRNTAFNEDFYFVKDYNVVLKKPTGYGHTARVFKFSFEIEDVLSEHYTTTAGLESILG